MGVGKHILPAKSNTNSSRVRGAHWQGIQGRRCTGATVMLTFVDHLQKS